MTETHSRNWYRVDNGCAHEIRVKIDVARARDITRTLDAAQGQTGTRIEGTVDRSFGAYIRAISCCSDHSKCNPD